MLLIPIFIFHFIMLHLQSMLPENYIFSQSHFYKFLLSTIFYTFTILFQKFPFTLLMFTSCSLLTTHNHYVH